MSEDIAVRVENVKKNFKIYYDRNRTLKDMLSMPGRGKEEKREVLKGISFSVKKGEAVALIGKNGCGKSTMLKLLTKIIYPNSGKIEVKGKVSSLIELGAGFHPDMSGRENIYLNASIFGLSKKEIDAKLDEIIEFSELEKFIDNPVRTYSSGMYMRLAFSVAINVQAEVLLIDEILGVGDVSFQKKCFAKLKQIKASGTTIVIVSHSTSQIEEICDRSIWICDGIVKEEGKTEIVDAHYYQYMENERLKKLGKGINKNQEKDIYEIQLPAFCDERALRSEGKEVFFEDLQLRNECGEECTVFNAERKIDIICRVKSKLVDCYADFGVCVCNESGITYFATSLLKEKGDMIRLKDTNRVEFSLKNINLLSGKYYLTVGLYSKDRDILDEIKFVKSFIIHSDYEEKENGILHMEHEWNLEDLEIESIE